MRGVFAGHGVAGFTILSNCGEQMRVSDHSTEGTACSIAVIGAGGLGNAIAWGLLSGWPTTRPLTLHLIDGDRVELSNLNRQILFQEEDVGRGKASLLSERLTQMRMNTSRNVRIVARKHAVTKENAEDLLSGHDYVLDATDSVAAKFLINDYCVKARIPFCYAGVRETYGQLLAVDPISPASGCLRCLFGCFTDKDYIEEGTTCRQRGIIGVVAGHLGFLQANAALAFLLGDPDASSAPSQLVCFSLGRLEHRVTEVRRMNDCILHEAGTPPSVIDLTDKLCPQTFLYTKLALEEAEQGRLLEVRFATEESARNVRQSVIEEGYSVVGSYEQMGGNVWRLRIMNG